LLRNPGFEDGTTGWTTQGKVRASGAHGGERALELGSPLTLDQDVENLGAGSYRASLFVKAPGAAKKLYFVIYDPTYSTVHAAEWNVSPSDAWHEARVEFTLSAEQAAAGVKLSLTFEATSPGALLLVDDASLATLERRPAASSKKGVILSAFQGTRAADLGAAWFSNWGTTSFGVPSALEFVPIIVDLTQATADDYARAKASGAATLLGFYEPHQRGLSVEQALSEWPRFMETGLRLGSPSGDEAWLDAFMRGAAERGHRVDFVAVTYYPDVTQADAVTRFEASLSALHQKYSLPIWVTAFGAMSWSSARPLEQADLDRFIRGAVPMLERLPYVERYAWFADRMKPEDGLIGSLLEPTGDELTPTGVTYLNRLR
jgi:hypothetical protein